MSAPPGRQPGARRHVTTACKACRDRKIKCDGEHPVCRACASRGRQCDYIDVQDKRKISLRMAAEIFSRRVRQLESCVQSCGVPVPEPAHDDAAMLHWLLDSYASATIPIPNMDVTSRNDITMASSDLEVDRAPKLASNLPTLLEDSSAPLSDIDHISHQGHAFGDVQAEDFPHIDFTFDADLVWNSFMLPGPNLGSDAMSADFASSLWPVDVPTLDPNICHVDQNLTDTLPEDDESTDDEEHSEITAQLSDRLGTLLRASNGEWRFYGATSNLHLMQVEHAAEPQSQHQRHEKIQDRLEHAGLGHFIDNELITHLVNLYFTWQDPSIHVVDKVTFEAARQRYNNDHEDNSFYSELLMNSICAIGASFERERHPELPVPLNEFFANRAKAILDLDLESPRTSTVQALAILSTHEGAAAQDTRGWLYSGMAMRLAYDLGLHISHVKYVKSGVMSAEEARVRKVAFWGAFATDRMWGFYLGRPFHNNLEDIHVERPSTSDTEFLEQTWVPYGTPGRDSLPLPSSQELLSSRWVALYEIMSNLGHSLYFRVDVTKVELVALGEETLSKLELWRSTMPEELAVDINALNAKILLPQTLIMHMQYAFFIIILHRPFVSKHYIQPSPLIGKGPEHARDMCVRSATEIALLVQEYDRRYTLRRANVLVVHYSFTAALILVYATVSEDRADVQAQLSSHLNTCCQALAELGNVYKSATRTLDILLSIKRTWQARLVAALGQKRSKQRGRKEGQKRRAIAS